MALNLEEWIASEEAETLIAFGVSKGRLDLLTELKEVLTEEYEKQNMDPVDSRDKDTNPKISQMDLRKPNPILSNTHKHLSVASNFKNSNLTNKFPLK